MARANVKVIIDDQSYVIPDSESGSSVRGGMPSVNGLILAVGYTAERKSGVMTIENISDPRCKDMPFLKTAIFHLFSLFKNPFSYFKV